MDSFRSQVWTLNLKDPKKVLDQKVVRKQNSRPNEFSDDVFHTLILFELHFSDPKVKCTKNKHKIWAWVRKIKQS